MVPHPHKNHNLVFNHVAIAVDSLEDAAEFYSKHFGFRRIRSDATSDRATDGDGSPIFKIYGNKLNKVKVAWLSTGNGIGFEIFEFIDPPTKKADDIKKDWTLEDQYQRGGFFHIAVTSPDPEGLAKRTSEDGAIQVGETITMYDGEKALYIRDPWGNVVEVLSCSFETLMGNR